MAAHEVAAPMKRTANAREDVLDASTRRYERRLGELEGLYRDADLYEKALASNDDAPVYWVEEARLEGSGESITGVSVLGPGRIGDEFYRTRGHLHAKPDRAERYLAISGRGVILLDDLEGNRRAIEISAGEAVQVPAYWVHRSVNVGAERFVTVFCYAADAGQSYAIIAEAGGMRDVVVVDGDGWTTHSNPDHQGYPRG